MSFKKQNRQQRSMHFVFFKKYTWKTWRKDSTWGTCCQDQISKLWTQVPQFLITCWSCCCCLLCFLAGRGGGVSFKGKGSTEGAMTSGQGADGCWVIGWGESVEGNIDPEQTDDLCFIGEKKNVSRWNERIWQRNEINNLIILFSYTLIK